MDLAYLWNFVSMFCSYMYDHSKLPETKSSISDRWILREDFDAMTGKIQSLETRLQESENQILELRKKDGTAVIFSAATGGRGRIGPYNVGTTMIYEQVITNVGNAYNDATGIFVAPYPGVYYFTIFHHAGGNPGTELFLCKNGQRVVQTQDHPSAHESANNAGNAVFLQLNQGEQVYVLMGPNQQVWGSGYHTTFSGFLVKISASVDEVNQSPMPVSRQSSS